MVVRISNSSCTNAIRLALIALGLSAFASCATKQEPQLIADTGGRESSLPWNKQEKWENTGQLGGMAERFQTR